MYTLEHGKIVNEIGVSISLEAVIEQLNKLEVLTDELTEELASIPHPSPKYDESEYVGQAEEYEVGESEAEPVQVDYESEYSGHWQTYGEATSNGRGY